MAIIRDIVKCALAWMLNKILRIFWLLPIDENSILFLSFNGKQYSDNPKYISQEIMNRFYQYKIVWAINDIEKWRAYIPEGVLLVPGRGLRFIIKFMTARAIVTNNGFPTYFPIRKRQIVLETWHGGGAFKKCGLSQNTVTMYLKFVYHMAANQYTAFVASSKVAAEKLFLQSFGYTRSECLNIGMPRNSILFGENQQIKSKVYSFLNIKEESDTGLIIYAPTFRGIAKDIREVDSARLFNVAEIIKAMEDKFQKKFYYLYRAHHAFSDNTSPLYNSCLDVTAYPDMQELLYAADVMLTDYSSCMWDMCLMRKPVFIYAPDLDEYLENRGFYCDFLSLPFPIARDQAELTNNIQNFDQKSYAEAVDRYLEDMGSYEGPDSTKKVCDWLENKMREE